MKTKFFSAILITISILSFKSDKMAYQLFDIKGNVTTYDQLLKKAKEADIVLFGELHDNPIGHWLQLELTKDLFEAKKSNLILGAEMFEADDQIALTEYLQAKKKIQQLQWVAANANCQLEWRRPIQ